MCKLSGTAELESVCVCVCVCVCNKCPGFARRGMLAAGIDSPIIAQLELTIQIIYKFAIALI